MSAPTPVSGDPNVLVNLPSAAGGVFNVWMPVEAARVEGEARSGNETAATSGGRSPR
jgi:hypothetical protein